MPMPKRDELDFYRYAYQGQEKDPETGKEAFELRLWDARIGRWLTTDPYGEFHSPYLGMGNNPISLTDPDGGMTSGGDPPDDMVDANGNPVMIQLSEVCIGCDSKSFSFANMPSFMQMGNPDHWQTEFKGSLEDYNIIYNTDYSEGNSYNEWAYQNHYQPARSEMIGSMHEATSTAADMVSIILPMPGAAVTTAKSINFLLKLRIKPLMFKGVKSGFSISKGAGYGARARLDFHKLARGSKMQNPDIVYQSFRIKVNH